MIYQRVEDRLVALFDERYGTINASLFISFEEHGLDSLDVLEFVMEVEEVLDIELITDIPKNLNEIALEIRFLREKVAA